MRSRICFATSEYPPHTGGVARSSQRLVRGLAGIGYDVTVFTVIVGDQSRADLPSHDGAVPIHWLPQDMTVAIDSIRRVHAERPFDLFHGFTLLAGYGCLAARGEDHRPVVASIRGLDGMAFDELSSGVLRTSDWITSVSGDSLTRARAVADLTGRSSVIPNGIDTQGFTDWHPTPMNAGVVGTVATFRPKKNIPLLIRAYARLPREIRRRLLLVGDAYDGNAKSADGRQAIDAAIAEAAIASEVEITGFVDHRTLPAWHDAMRVFALSSDHEGMPNAILEAAATGLPIVSTAVDGVKEILTDGVNALLVEPGNVEALAAALARVLTDMHLATCLSSAVRLRAQELTVAAELRRYIDVYEKLLTKTGEASTSSAESTALLDGPEPPPSNQAASCPCP